MRLLKIFFHYAVESRKRRKEVNPNFYDNSTKDGIGVAHKYDNDGNRILTIYPEGETEAFRYDSEKNGGPPRLTYDKNDRMQRLALPKEVAEKGEEAKGYRYAYDASDRILSLTGPDGTLIYERSYNPYGELERETDNRGSGIRFVYDYIGRRIHAKTTGNAEYTTTMPSMSHTAPATKRASH